MKKITKIIPIFCILIATILSIIFLDIQESRKYFQFQNYEKDFISIKYSDSVKIDNKMLENILSLAEKHDVILEKSNISQDDENITNIYLSLKNQEELINFINKSLKVENLSTKAEDSKAYVSTYDHNDKNQIGLIPDFLKNNYYNYYTFDNLLENNGNLYGEYVVYYKNYNDFDQFTSDVEKIVAQDLKSYSTFNNSQQYILIAIIASVVILMLFYFIFQIYESYYNSKKIACMKLLGIDHWKISNIMIKNKLKLYCGFVLFVLIIVLIFAQNIDFYKIMFLLSINALLIILTYLLNYMCIKIILKGYQTSSILKKQNIAIKISKTSSKLKMITIILLVISISFLFQNMSTLFSSLELYNNSKKILDYGILYDFNADSGNIYEYEKQSTLFKKIYNDESLNTFYTEFSRFQIKSEEEQKIIDEWYEQGKEFEYGSVDRNYLKKEKITIYDLNNKKVDIDDIDGVFFLFPKSKTNKIEQFDQFYKNDSKSDYDKYNINYDFQAFVYEDQKIDTYRLDLKLKYVESPILRVIDDSVTLSYLESSRGLSTFGNGLNTGLKIEIENNKNETFKVLEKHIQESGLSELLTINNFMSFNDYFNNEIQTARLISMVVTIALLLVLIVYIVISIQVISLYVKSESQKVTVKYLLGHNKYDIFSEIIDKNLKYNIISFIIIVLILIILNKFNVLLFIISISTFLVIDFTILFLIIKFYDFSKVYIQLKGGNYD